MPALISLRALAQLLAAQMVPAGWRRQPPVPSHPPARPQLLAASARHCLRGSWPVGTSVQVPSFPATLQARQVSPHGLLQQKPSTQYPLMHCKAAEQALPGPRLTAQRLPSQKNPV